MFSSWVSNRFKKKRKNGLHAWLLSWHKIRPLKLESTLENIVLIISFHKWGNWESERLSDFLNITDLVNDRNQNRNRVIQLSAQSSFYYAQWKYLLLFSGKLARESCLIMFNKSKCFVSINFKTFKSKKTTTTNLGFLKVSDKIKPISCISYANVLPHLCEGNVSSIKKHQGQRI